MIPSLWVYIILNIAIAVIYLKKDFGVFQLPFLAACVSLSFICPQLFAISHIAESGYMQTAILVMILCNSGLFLGYALSREKYKEETLIISPIKSKNVIIGFMLIGVTAYLLNRGKYTGGQAEGVYVIINFFTSYLLYALTIIVVSLGGNNKQRFVVFVLIIVCLVYIDKITSTGRRNDAVAFFIIIIYFLSLRNEKIQASGRWLIPMFFFIGAIANTQISNYRNSMYEGGKSTQAIAQLDFSNAEKDIEENDEGEVNNAIVGINFVNDEGSYDYGASNFNRLIKDFIPSGFVGGPSNKKALMIKTSDTSLVSSLTETGLTMTGYFDAYASFGWLCWIKFLIIGFFMGHLWKNMIYNQLYEIMYFSLITVSLHTITHHTSFFFNNLFFFYVFVYIFVIRCTFKQDTEIDFETETDIE